MSQQDDTTFPVGTITVKVRLDKRKVREMSNEDILKLMALTVDNAAPWREACKTPPEEKSDTEDSIRGLLAYYGKGKVPVAYADKARALRNLRREFIRCTNYASDLADQCDKVHSSADEGSALGAEAKALGTHHSGAAAAYARARDLVSEVLDVKYRPEMALDGKEDA